MRVLDELDDNLVLVEGFHALKHALRFNATVFQILSSDIDGLSRLITDLAPDLHSFLPQVEHISRDTLRSLAGRKIHTDVLSFVKRPTWTIDNIIGENRVGILLDEPRNLGNVGACIRVAAAAGAAGVILNSHLDPFDSAIIRGAAGLQFAIPVVSISDLRLITGPKRSIIGFDDSGQSFHPANDFSHSLLAFGSERVGLSDSMLAHCQQVVALPMVSGVSSLNLATAVSAALYAIHYSQKGTMS